MTPVIETQGLGKQFRRKWAQQECTISIPDGRVVGPVGPNGAAKTTLLQLAAGVQARLQTVIVVGLLAVMAIALAISGPHLIHLYSPEGPPRRTSDSRCPLTALGRSP